MAAPQRNETDRGSGTLASGRRRTIWNCTRANLPGDKAEVARSWNCHLSPGGGCSPGSRPTSNLPPQQPVCNATCRPAQGNLFVLLVLVILVLQM